jgi:hypothetical protein
VVLADAYPNFSICGIPYYISGEVTHWRNLAHCTWPPRRRRQPTSDGVRRAQTQPDTSEAPRAYPGTPLKSGLKFAHEPKEIDVEPRIVGTRLLLVAALARCESTVGRRHTADGAISDLLRAAYA